MKTDHTRSETHPFWKVFNSCPDASQPFPTCKAPKAALLEPAAWAVAAVRLAPKQLTKWPELKRSKHFDKYTALDGDDSTNNPSWFRLQLNTLDLNVARLLSAAVFFYTWKLYTCPDATVLHSVHCLSSQGVLQAALQQRTFMKQVLCKD